MKNITVTLPDEMALEARILAAKADTSMSQYLGGLLVEKVQSNREYENAMKRYFSSKPQKLQNDAKAYPSRDSIHDRDALR